jgi:hypothetical protein
VNLAWTLDARLPGIRTALEEGRLDPGRVKLIADETSVLQAEGLFARAEAIILAGLPGCTTWSDLQRLVQRAVITVDPDGARRRRERAEREDARIRFWRENTGTCALRGTGLPADQALAATAHIEARALEYKAVPIRRPMDILRVMAYLDLINGVSVSQRAGWAQAEDEARQAESADAGEHAARDADLRDAVGQARDKFREKARARVRHHGGTADGRDDPGPGESPGNGHPGDSAPDDSGSGGSADGDGPSGGRPGGGGGHAGPGSANDGTPGAGGPGDSSDSRLDSDGGFPDDWPDDDWLADDGHPGAGDLASDGLADGLLPEDLPTGGNGGDRCPGCNGAGGGGGLPIRANLTLPAGAIPWLARRAGRAWNPAENGPSAGGGGGGPGSGCHGGHRSCQACGNRGSERMPVRGNLALPLLTLLRLAERPGEAHGLGAVDPGVARDLAVAGARHPASEFCVTITDERGYAIGHGCCTPASTCTASPAPWSSCCSTARRNGSPPAWPTSATAPSKEWCRL